MNVNFFSFVSDFNLWVEQMQFDELYIRYFLMAEKKERDTER